MAALRFLPAGNYSRRVSYSAWLYCVSYRQETIREGFPTWRGTVVFLIDRKLFTYSFPTRLGTVVFLADRKLFAKGFLLDAAPLCFLPTGNYSRRVSCSTRLHCVSCRQETIREGFPARRGSIVFLTGRKLFAYSFLLDVAPLCFLPTGNCLRRVSCSTWHCSVSYRQATFRV